MRGLAVAGVFALLIGYNLPANAQLRKVDGWQTLATKPIDQVLGLDPGIDLAV